MDQVRPETRTARTNPIFVSNRYSGSVRPNPLFEIGQHEGLTSGTKLPSRQRALSVALGGKWTFAAARANDRFRVIADWHVARTARRNRLFDRRRKTRCAAHSVLF